LFIPTLKERLQLKDWQKKQYQNNDAGNVVHSAVARGGYYEWDLNNQEEQEWLPEFILY
jgi:hypothetical protein